MFVAITWLAGKNLIRRSKLSSSATSYKDKERGVGVNTYILGVFERVTSRESRLTLPVAPSLLNSRLRLGVRYLRICIRLYRDCSGNFRRRFIPFTR